MWILCFRTKLKSDGKLVLNHSLDKFINLVFTITEISTFNKVIVLLAPSTRWCVKLEWPEEVVYLLKDSATSVDLIYHVFNTLDVVSLLQFTFNYKIVGDWNAFSCMLKMRIKDTISQIMLNE
ncbi:hypothetical protein ACKWTF_006225 [Chironomus riparius]